MSILISISDHVLNGALVDLLPLEGGPTTRRMLLAPDVWQQLDPSSADEDLAPGAGRLRAWCDRYVKGATMVVGSGRHEDADIKILDPWNDEVWELRKRDSPSTRVFGRFAYLDAFVATNVASTMYLWSIKWVVRGVRRWPIWNQAIRNCKARWRSLFHPYGPVSGGVLSDYLTRAIDQR
jgi:hypothetical protein